MATMLLIFVINFFIPILWRRMFIISDKSYSNWKRQPFLQLGREHVWEKEESNFILHHIILLHSLAVYRSRCWWRWREEFSLLFLRGRATSHLLELLWYLLRSFYFMSHPFPPKGTRSRGILPKGKTRTRGKWRCFTNKWVCTIQEKFTVLQVERHDEVLKQKNLFQFMTCFPLTH